MPIQSYLCLNEHKRDVFLHTWQEKGVQTVFCSDCNQTMSPVLSFGKSLTWFAEGGKGKWIHNLGPEPVLVTSHAHHKELMRQAGVDWAPARRGMKGCW